MGQGHPHGRHPRRLTRPFAAAALAAALAAPPTACAQGAPYPTRPVRLVLAFAPGGVGDVTARLVAQKLTESFGQQVIVDNRPSAGGVVAAETVARAEPDGHTLLLLTNGNAISVALFKSLSYDPARDFAPVSLVGEFDMAIVVAPSSPFNSVRDLIAAAKADRARINLATINPGSTQFLSGELFKSMAGIDIQTVTFKATPAIITAVRGGEIQVAIDVLAPLLPQIRSGGLKALAVSSNRRFAGLPNVPTVAESGLTGYAVSGWNSIAAPAKTPRAIVDRLSRDVNAALGGADLRQKFQELGVEAKGSSPEVLRQVLAAEIAKWKDVVTRAGIERQ